MASIRYLGAVTDVGCLAGLFCVTIFGKSLKLIDQEIDTFEFITETSFGVRRR
jgi:hypothetical protein